MDRRSFFTHFMPAQDKWKQFIHRIERSLLQFVQADAVMIDDLSKLPHLFKLAQQYEVTLSCYPTAQTVRPVLQLLFSDRLNTITPINDTYAIASPCTTLGQLSQLGYHQFDYLPKELYLWQWFADPCYHRYPTEQLPNTGVERVQVIFANAQEGVLGGFGVNDKLALDLLILNQAVPQLFQIYHQAWVREYEKKGGLPYRLDALQAGQTNLARLMLGSRQTLVLPTKYVLSKQLSPLENKVFNAVNDVSEVQLAYDMQLETSVKNAFDELGIFPHLTEYEIS